jgi:simple sugar transport system ATP-binding protein
VRALEDVSLEIRAGERLALVGENGAGKSTLMNVLYGLYRPDSGTLRVEGRDVVFRSPRDALAHGVGMVHQHFMLVPGLTVAENVVLGAEPGRWGLLDVAAAERAVAGLSERFGFEVDARARVGDLGVGARQKVEILKALHRGARVLVLDEPTAVLTPEEADELFAVARRLSDEGTAVVLVSHKLREVLAFATRVAVMRRGRKVAEFESANTTAEELAAHVMGEPPPPPPAFVAATPGEVLLELSGVHALGPRGRPALKGVELQVRAGEVVGIAGVDGNGQRELAEVATGLRAWLGGEVKVRGTVMAEPSPALFRDAGVGHVPEDRHRHGMVSGFTVEENLSLGRHRAAPFARGPWIDLEGRSSEVARALDAWDVRPRDGTLELQVLSGGNQQKAVMARELERRPSVLVVVQPTRGLDIGAVASVRARLREHAAKGGAVLLVSLDLEEVLALSDRAYVLYDGRTVAALDRAHFDERRMGRLMLGTEAAAHG